MKRRQNLAIIGSGPSAIYLLKHLLDAAAQSQCRFDRISVFEKSTITGVGMPYSPVTTDRHHLANISSEEIPALTVSLAEWLREQPDAVLEPLQMTNLAIDDKAIYSRLAVGGYFRAQYRSIIDTLASHGIRIEEYRGCRVTDIRDRSEDNQVELITCGGDQLRFDTAVIATGHFWPETDEVDAGYYASPWPIAKLIPPDGDYLNHTVGTLGASLSAFDVVSSLAHRHGRFLNTPEGLSFAPHPGAEDFRIVMYSAAGLLPHLHYEQTQAMGEMYRHVDRETLLALVNADGFLRLDAYFDAVCRPVLIQAFENDGVEEVAHLLAQPGFAWDELVGEMTARHTYEDAFEGMRAELSKARHSVRDQRPLHWKEALDDLMYTLNFHAERLPAEDHRRLHSSILPFLMNIVAALPLESAERLLALHDAGKLELTQGKIVDVHQNPAEATTAVQLEGSSGAAAAVYRTFVDCSGQPPLLDLSEYPFPALVRDQTVRPTGPGTFFKLFRTFENISAGGAIAFVRGIGPHFVRMNKPPTIMSREKSTFTTLAVLGAGLILPMVAAHASRRLAGLGYRVVTDEDPPRNPAAREVDWRNAIVWSVISGAIGGLARLSVRRALAPTDIPAEGYDLESQADEILD